MNRRTALSSMASAAVPLAAGAAAPGQEPRKIVGPKKFVSVTTEYSCRGETTKRHEAIIRISGIDFVHQRRSPEQGPYLFTDGCRLSIIDGDFERIVKSGYGQFLVIAQRVALNIDRIQAILFGSGTEEFKNRPSIMVGGRSIGLETSELNQLVELLDLNKETT